MEKIRTIITQDGEVDDQNSLRHILLYSNDIEIQGIILTSSKFHYAGNEHIESYRFTGTKWMNEIIDDYAVVYPNLKLHDVNYPTPEYLHSIVYIGNINNVGDMSYPTEGSNKLKEAILDNDPRKLYVQLWGGANTLARALYDIKEECEDFEAMKQFIYNKVVVTACGEQDDTYNDFIKVYYPDLVFITCMQMKSYAYAWNLLPECKGKETLKASYMQENILNKGKLLEGYCTWLDGHNYEGELYEHQFGIKEDINDTWWGKDFIGTYHQYDFLSEGDSPTFFCLLPFGLRFLEGYTYPSLSGRYRKDEGTNYYRPITIDYEGKECESMVPYIHVIQNDFAHRANMCISPIIEKAPVVSIEEGFDLNVSKGQNVMIHLHKDEHCDYYISVDDISDTKDVYIYDHDDYYIIQLPEDMKKDDKVHIIIEAVNNYGYHLTRFGHLILNVVEVL